MGRLTRRVNHAIENPVRAAGDATKGLLDKVSPGRAGPFLSSIVQERPCMIAQDEVMNHGAQERP
jgi:hypothetical protein